MKANLVTPIKVKCVLLYRKDKKSENYVSFSCYNKGQAITND